MSQSELRKLPSIDKLLQAEAGAILAEQHGHELTADALRAPLDKTRQAILNGESAPKPRLFSLRPPGD